MTDKERCAFKGRARIRSSVALGLTLCFRLPCLLKNGSAHQLTEEMCQLKRHAKKQIFSVFLTTQFVHVGAWAPGGAPWRVFSLRRRSSLLEAELPSAPAACPACTPEPSGLRRKREALHETLLGCAGIQATPSSWSKVKPLGVPAPFSSSLLLLT